MNKATAMKFSQNWRKLNTSFFLTVRWTDTEYPLDVGLPIMIGGKPNGEVCTVIFGIDVRLGDLLTPSFTDYDADCSPEEYMKMMEGWYSKKETWSGEDSVVQLLGCVKV